MRIFQKKLKAFIVLSLVFELFVSSTTSVLAFPGGSTIPSSSQLVGDILEELHIDQDAVQNQGEMLNVAKNKGSAPQVSISFSPSDPKEGEKLTAKAMPMYFVSKEEYMYYTWYLKRKGCNVSPYDSKNPEPKDKLLESCDVDKNDRVTVEDWKVTAMRILVQNGYEPDSLLQVYTDTSTDNDEYKAFFGGDDKGGVGGKPTDGVRIVSHCYAHDNGTGLNHELVSSEDDAAEPNCKHLFPRAPGHQTAQDEGNGYSFGSDEEEFWGTDPQDPSTMGNGTKDEANVAGLGRSSFKWNYSNGDQVGVVVEGTSMYPTKYEDATGMIMWGFSKNICPIPEDNKSTITPTIKGRDVEIPSVDTSDSTGWDINECLEDNLVDPTIGGQSTNLEVSVSASPENPINDPTEDRSGDTIVVQATVDNAVKDLANTQFEWTVSIGDSIGSFNDGTARAITADLRDLGLLGTIKGNALDSIKVKLNIPPARLTTYLGTEDTGYLKFQVTALENFSEGIIRKGKGDIIVKFTSTKDNILAKRVNVDPTTINLSLGDPICNAVGTLDRTICRVIKNEIIGLEVKDEDLTSFYWTINGKPLVCNARVSKDCSLWRETRNVSDESVDATEQGRINYFPVTGNPGDTYSISVTATNIRSGREISFTRAFNVVTPQVLIESVGTNAWPKLLGQYKDLSQNATVNCPGGLCEDRSESVFQAFTGSPLSFKATFIPNFPGRASTNEWYVDGVFTGTVDVPNSTTVPIEQMITFTASKPAPSIYTVNLLTQILQPDIVRRALLDIWGISPFESSEMNFSTTVQVEISDPVLAYGPQSGPQKYLAAIASYVPASIMFSFRIFLSAALVLFVLALLHTFLEERRVRAFVENFAPKRE